MCIHRICLIPLREEGTRLEEGRKGRGEGRQASGVGEGREEPKDLKKKKGEGHQRKVRRIAPFSQPYPYTILRLGLLHAWALSVVGGGTTFLGLH